MHAVICGGSADALVLAHRLSIGGWSVVLITDGAQRALRSGLVELSPEALTALKDLGLLPRLLDLAEPIARVRWVDARGRSIAGLQIEHLRGARAPASVLVTQENLEKLLLESLPPAVIRISGTRVVALEERPKEVQLKLDSGASLGTQLLVGADGGDSRIRNLVFGSGGVWRRPLGYHVAAFVFRDANVRRELGPELSILSTPGRLFALCPLRGDDIVATFAFRMHASERPTDPAVAVTSNFSELGWCVPAVVKHAQSARDLYYDRATQIKAATWHRGRVGLLGDACYAYSMLPGHGCNSSMKLAYALGEGLSRGMSLDTAFSGYECQLAYEVAARRQAKSRLTSWLMPDSRTSLAVRNSLLRITRVPGFARFVKPTASLAL